MMASDGAFSSFTVENLIVDDLVVTDSLSLFGSEKQVPARVDYTISSIVKFLKSRGLASTEPYASLDIEPFRAPGASSSGVGKFSTMSANGDVLVMCNDNQVWVNFISSGLQCYVGAPSPITCNPAVSETGTSLVVCCGTDVYVFTKDTADPDYLSYSQLTIDYPAQACDISNDGTVVAVYGMDTTSAPLLSNTDTRMVFRLSGGTWDAGTFIEKGGRFNPDYDTLSGFDICLSADGNQLAFGFTVPGGVMVHRYIASTWTPVFNICYAPIESYYPFTSRYVAVAMSRDKSTICYASFPNFYASSPTAVVPLFIYAADGTLTQAMFSTDIAISTGYVPRLTVSDAGTEIVFSMFTEGVGAIVHLISKSAAGWAVTRILSEPENLHDVNFGTCVKLSASGARLLVNSPGFNNGVGSAYVFSAD